MDALLGANRNTEGGSRITDASVWENSGFGLKVALRYRDFHYQEPAAGQS
jgi:hypothetical protein